MPAKPLTQEQLEDAARLSAFFKEWQRARKDAQLPSSQIDAAHELGFGQSALSQYLRGDIPLNVPAGVKFAKLLGKRLEEISPQLASKFTHFVSEVDFVVLDDRANMTLVELKSHAPGKKSIPRPKAEKSIAHELPSGLPDYVLSAVSAVLGAYHNKAPREVFDGISALLSAKITPHTAKSGKDETATKGAPRSRLTDEANRAKDATKSHLATRSEGARGTEEGERKHRRHKGH